MMHLIYPLTTLSFAYPQAFAFPLVLAFLYLTSKNPAEAVLTPSISDLAKLSPSVRMRLRTPILGCLLSVFVVLLTIAAARPQKPSVLASPYEARNIFLVLDLSRSMSTVDFGSRSLTVSRLSGVKTVVEKFIENRPHDRIGLVVFGGHAFLQSPLTLDHGLVQELVRRLEVGIAGDATAIGDGLGLALKRIQDIEGKSKAVILLTDGVSNAGQVNPLKAAKVAKTLGVKVHTIGIGSAGTILNIQPGLFAHGATQAAEFDEKTLTEVAQITGGVYFNADSTEGLEKVYSEIDHLETSVSEESEQRITEEFFPQYAAAAALVYLAYLLLARSIFLKVP